MISVPLLVIRFTLDQKSLVFLNLRKKINLFAITVFEICWVMACIAPVQLSLVSSIYA